MSQHQAWISLDECINSYIDESQQSNSSFFRLWQFAFRIMSELGLDFFYQIRSFKLPVNDNKTVNMPDKQLNWVKVGVLNAVGEIIPLIYNEKLTTYAEFSPNRIQKTQDDTLFNLYQYNAPIWYNYWDGNTFITQYGIPSGAPFVGTFKVDRHANIILLGEEFCYDYVMLECIMPPDQSQPYHVPIQFKEAIIAGLGWLDTRSIPSKTHVNNSNVLMRRKEFYNQRRLGWARYRPFNLMDAYQWSLTNRRMVVKS